ERDIADGEKARELLGQPLGFKNELIGQTVFPLPARGAGCPLFTSAFRTSWTVPEHRLRPRNMPEVTGVRQGGNRSKRSPRQGCRCILSRGYWAFRLPYRSPGKSGGHQAVVNGLRRPAPVFMKNFPAISINARDYIRRDY